MAIDKLYRRAEQDWIEADILQEKAKYTGTPRKAVRYFRRKAEEYHLFERAKNQFNAYKTSILSEEELTTNEEIAKLFHVVHSTVSRYLEDLARKSGKSEDFKDRAEILRCAGGSRGGRNGSTKGYKQKRTWSRKKK